MNGIKKVFSHHRNSNSSSSVDGGEDSIYPDSSSPKLHPSNPAHNSARVVEPTPATNGLKVRETKESKPLTTEVDTNSLQTPISRKSESNSVIAPVQSPQSPQSPTAKVTEKTDRHLGRSQEVSARDGSMKHSHHSGAGQVDLTKGDVTQSVEHVADITSKTLHNHTTEEVERQRNIDRHQHHVQVLHQPVREEEHSAEQLHQKVHPVTNINERHMSTEQDAKLLKSVANSHNHRNETRHAAHDVRIVDKGELVSENLHTHVHKIVVPLVSHDVHEHHRVQTVIPLHHTVHEAPIIHESSTLKPISRADFIKEGGILGSSVKDVEKGNFLTHGTCERSVDGLGEQLVKDLKLKPTNTLT